MESLQQYFEQKKNSMNRIHVRDAGVFYKKKLCKLAESDFETIFDQLVSQESEQPGERTLTFEEFGYYFSCLKEIEEKTFKPFSTYLNNLHDFVKVKDSKLEQDRKNHAGDLDIIDTQFSDVCPKYFFDSLQRTKALGEFEYIQKLNAGFQKYVYHHRVEHNINLPVEELGDLYHLKFLYYIWNFQWEKALNILKEYLINQKEYEEALSVLPIFEDFAEVAQCIKENSSLKQIFYFRKGEEIRYNRQNMEHRKVYEKFQSSIQFMEGMVEIITNPILRLACSFLSNQKPNHSLVHESPQLPVFARFMYAKKFLQNSEFAIFEKNLRTNFENLIKENKVHETLDYILLFGKGKNSQTILQNYLDRTNDIRKVAIISVFLTGFQSEKEEKKKNKGLLVTFRQIYEDLLDKIDISGRQSRQFYRKCCEMQFWRIKIRYQKTLTFKCESCGVSKLFRQMKRKIEDSLSPQFKQQGLNRVKVEMVKYGHAPEQIQRCLVCDYFTRCMVCLFNITYINPAHEIHNSKRRDSVCSTSSEFQHKHTEKLSNALVCCPKCFHGGHFQHIKKWQQLHPRKCVIPNCECPCSF